MSKSSAWAVKHWNGGIYIDTVRRTRWEAVAAFKKLYGISNRRWCKDYGVHRPVKVAVLELGKYDVTSRDR